MIVMEQGHYQIEVCKSVPGSICIPRSVAQEQAGVEQTFAHERGQSTATRTATRDRGAEWIGYATIADDLRGCG